MASFHGRYDYSVDAKGRVNVPAKFRKSLSPEADDTFIVVRGPRNSLRAYPKDVWERGRGAELDALPETPDNNLLKSMIFGSSIDSALDVQGRITLSPTLMGAAGITKDATLVGVSSYIEIWDTAKYDEYSEAAGNFDEIFFKAANGLAGQ